jgi:hypothetical protein
LIDKTPPVLTSDYNNAWQPTDANLHITCSDVNALADYSGCKTIFYKKDTSQNDDTNTWATIAAYDYNIYWNTSGTWALDFNATDNTDNNSLTTQLVIKIDKSNPWIATSIPAFGDTTAESQITLDVNDLYSGIQSIAVKINGTTSTKFTQSTKCTAFDVNQISPTNYHCIWSENLATGANTLTFDYNDYTGHLQTKDINFTWTGTVTGGGGPSGGGGPGGGDTPPGPTGPLCFEIVWPLNTDEKGFVLLKDTMIRGTKKEEIIKIKNICTNPITVSLSVDTNLNAIMYPLSGQAKTIQPGKTETLSVMVVTDENTTTKTWEGKITITQTDNASKQLTAKITIVGSPLDIGLPDFKKFWDWLKNLFSIPVAAGRNTGFYFGCLGMIIGGVIINNKTKNSLTLGGTIVTIAIMILFTFGGLF